jgi:hypothetical protein
MQKQLAREISACPCYLMQDGSNRCKNAKWIPAQLQIRFQLAWFAWRVTETFKEEDPNCPNSHVCLST